MHTQACTSFLLISNNKKGSTQEHTIQLRGGSGWDGNSSGSMLITDIDFEGKLESCRNRS